ncbi:hypothetical protein IX51_03980 [uncultured archaeon]|nr:hypothetical protein IX51_03980 [uncultured archaeon]
MPKLKTYRNDDSIYYYDTRETCAVKLPEIETSAVLNAEVLNYNGNMHCDLVFIGRNGVNTEVYLIELRDVNNPNPDFVANVISPETVKNKAEGSLWLLENEIIRLFPNLRLRTGNVKVTFILLIGEPAMEALGYAGSLFTRIKTEFRFLARRGIDEARIKTCGCDVYSDTSLGFELLR